MKISPRSLLVALGLCLALPLSGLAQDAKPAKPLPAVGESVLVELTATVQAINADTREVTLKGPLGNVVTLTVDPRVERFAEIKVGDEVAAEYYVSLAVELRAPTEEEKKSPITILKDKARAPADAAPAGGGFRVIKAVVTVEGLDRPTSSATLKGPRGNYATVQVKDRATLEGLRLGDTVVVTYTEAFAVELQKAAPAKAH